MDFTHICSIQHEIVVEAVDNWTALLHIFLFTPKPSRLRHVHVLAIAETQEWIHLNKYSLWKYFFLVISCLLTFYWPKQIKWLSIDSREKIHCRALGGGAKKSHEKDQLYKEGWRTETFHVIYYNKKETYKQP